MDNSVAHDHAYACNCEQCVPFTRLALAIERHRDKIEAGLDKLGYGYAGIEQMLEAMDLYPTILGPGEEYKILGNGVQR